MDKYLQFIQMNRKNILTAANGGGNQVLIDYDTK